MNAWHVSKGVDGKGRPYHIVREVRVDKECTELPGRCLVLDNGMHVSTDNVWYMYPYWAWTVALASAITKEA